MGFATVATPLGTVDEFSSILDLVLITSNLLQRTEDVVVRWRVGLRLGRLLLVAFTLPVACETSLAERLLFSTFDPTWR
jgi:hypothetical protein